jgi:spermidine synthase
MSGSGFAGLGYQVVWTRQFGVWLGHELVAVLAIVAAFFGGLALGAWLLSPFITRSTRPALWYAGCELTLAVWALVLSVCVPIAGAHLISWIGIQPSPLRHWSVAFIAPFLLLLPSTAAMGATLPAIERVIARLRTEGFAIGSLYAANTAGAVLGVLACAFVLVPALGLTNTARICAALNALCALIAYLVWRTHRFTQADVSRSGNVSGSMRERILTVLFATGALGIGYEVLVVRVLSQIMEDTVYTFAILLAVYLLGTAAGGALYQHTLARRADANRLQSQLIMAVAAACMLGAAALYFSNALRIIAANALSALLPGIAAALGSEALVAMVAFLLPTAAMGALFSHLCVVAKARGMSFGTAIAANTLGGAFAPLLFGVLLAPAIGPKLTFVCVSGGYVSLLLGSRENPHRRLATSFYAACILAAVFGVALLAPPLAFVDVPPGGRIVRYEDGVTAAVSVVENASGVATLHIDNRQAEGSSATLLSDARQAWLPLLLHSKPSTALFLGLGTGLTAYSAQWDAGLKVDAVELLPEVANASKLFVAKLGAPPHILIADARRYVRAASQRYDVIVADLFHPARNGAGALYTVEHFAAARARLAPGGLFCQWLPLHQLDMDSLRSVIAAFLQVYPDATALLATNSLDTPVLALIAQPDSRGVQLSSLRARLQSTAHSAHLDDLHLEDELAVLGTFIAGPEALRKFSAGAAINTDDHPVVIQHAPFITYAANSEPRDRLIALLRAVHVSPEEVLAQGDGETRERLAAYWSARTHFIQVGARVRPSEDVRSMLTQVRGPLLDILHISPDFRPAYDPLLNMAAALAQQDAVDARALLLELAHAQPARPEAHQLLQRLASAAHPEP